MMKRLTFAWCGAVMGMLSGFVHADVGGVIDIAGPWRFALDEKGVGVAENWPARSLEDVVTLPGTTDTNKKGKKTVERPVDRLSRVWSWIGPAWYQRDVEIPEAWTGKRVSVFFERTKNTKVWMNGELVGRENSLSAPHVFDVTRFVKAGKNTITVLIDNAKLPPVGPAHAVDERTQTNWNGIVGRMELQATDRVWISDVQVYPMVQERKVRVRMNLGNDSGAKVRGRVTLSAQTENFSKQLAFAKSSHEVEMDGAAKVVEWIYEPGGDVPLWSEFQPALLRMKCELQAEVGAKAYAHETSVRFGMREFKQADGRLLMNGKVVYLRGRLDCANYPLTGYAPMSLEEWRKIFAISKDWGLNHYRFHSWCPPAAAFEAADEMGILIHAELPNKRSAFKAPDDANAAKHNIDFMTLDTVEADVSLYDYCMREGAMIFRNYGNSASFVMFALGNELGRNPSMYEMVAKFQKLEPRALHAQGSNNVHWDASFAKGDDFWVTAKVGKNKLVRGAFSLLDSREAHIEFKAPSTDTDYRNVLAGIPVPVISHEIGSFQVSPDFRDIAKFTGVLEARNYEIFRERAEKAGLLGQAHDFMRASGALSALCYREEIEAALRTPGFGGFQLLDIVDFPGQGTALVGMLNVFMESKGIIEPEQWREFCSETVPLFRMEKYAWMKHETLAGKIEIAHYGERDLENAVVKVVLTNGTGDVLQEKDFPSATIKVGGLRAVGDYAISLNQPNIAAPEMLTLKVSLVGTKYQNRYPLWVYPSDVPTPPSAGVKIATQWDDAAVQEHLAQGGKVLLFPPLAALKHCVNGGFHPDFWSPMFAQAHQKRGEELPPGTLGILCDPQHPVFASFPTEYHSNWQWWHLVKHSKPIIYDGAPADFLPLVQGIDNFVRNQKLGLIAETKFGKGSVVICSIDLLGLKDRPEARQMLHSVLSYMDSTKFAPKQEVSKEWFDKITAQ